MEILASTSPDKRTDPKAEAGVPDAGAIVFTPTGPKISANQPLGAINELRQDHSTHLTVLVNVNHIAVRVRQYDAPRTVGLLSHLTQQSDVFAFQLTLYFPDIIIVVNILGVFIPTGIEGYDVALKHALE